MNKPSSTSQRSPWTTLLWRGIKSNLLNPKVALFVQSGQADTFSPFKQMIWPGAIFSVLTTIAYGALGAAAGGVSRWLAAHPTYMRNVNRASAGLFIASGAAILLVDRHK